MQPHNAITLDTIPWINSNPNIAIMNVETVVLPNIHRYSEGGSTDPELTVSQTDGQKARWNQFFRVWYR